MKNLKGKIYNGLINFKSVDNCLSCKNTKFNKLYKTLDLRINQIIQTVICDNCGFIFQNPMPTEESYINFYKSQRTSSTDKSLKEIIDPKRKLHELFIEIIKDNIGDINEMNALDYGSGNGSFLYFLKPLVKSLVSVEISEKAQYFIPKIFSVNVHQGISLKKAKIKENSLDFISALAVIEHFHNPIHALNDFYEHLKEDGYLFLYTHDVKKPYFHQNKQSYFKFIHPYYFSINTLSNCLLQAGFKNIRYLEFDVEKNLNNSGTLDITAGFIVVIAQKNDRGSKQIFKDKYQQLRLIFFKSTVVYYFFYFYQFFLKIIFKFKNIIFLASHKKVYKYEKTFEDYKKKK